MGSGATETRTGNHMGSWHLQSEDLNHCAIVLGPLKLFNDHSQSLGSQA